MRAMMQYNDTGTLMTGEEACEEGIVDEIIEGTAARNFAPEELTSMRNQLSAFYNSVRQGGDGQQQQPKSNTMENKETVGHHEAAPSQVSTVAQGADHGADILTLRNEIKELRELNQQAERARITNDIDALVTNDQVTKAEREKALARAIKDPTYLDELRARPSLAPGAAPLPSANLELVSEAFEDVQKFVLNNGPRFTDQFIGPNAHRATGLQVCKDIASRAFSVANAIQANKAKILSQWNSNTIDSGLQRQVILQDMLEAYAIVFARLDAFSTIYNSVPLEGTDKIDVPYFPLQSNAAVQFVSGTGYTTARDWTQQKKEITVGGDGDASTSGASATTGTAKDRLYMAINFRSYDLRRQPYLNLVKLFQQAANKLAIDVITQIVSRVITAANFTTVAKTVASAAFVGDDVADLRAAATQAYWPEMSRYLILDDTYYTSLLKDTDFKHQYSYGTTDPLHLGRIPQAYGFEFILDWANLTNYVEAAQNLTGWINHKSAVLVATSPIMPTEDVRILMTRYDVVVDPKTGMAFEYRRFGNTTTDQTTELIECSFGAAVGVATALQRIRSAAP